MKYHLLGGGEAGMRWLAPEGNCVRDGKYNTRDAYASIRGNAIWLLNCHMSDYLPGGPFNHTPLRPRKLLLHQSEIEKLDRKTEQKGVTIVPLRIYFREGKAKCEIALAQGKKQWDRRQSERDKEAKREVGEAMYKFRQR